MGTTIHNTDRSDRVVFYIIFKFNRKRILREKMKILFHNRQKQETKNDQ